MYLRSVSLWMHLKRVFSNIKKTKGFGLDISLKMRETLVLRQIFRSVPILSEVMLACECVCCVPMHVREPLSNRSASSHTATTFSPHGNLARRAKIKTSLSSLFNKNNRLWLLSLLSSLSLPLPLTAYSPSLPSLSIGDQGEACFNY